MSRISVAEMLAMRAAYEAASISPDRSTQNGVVILGDSNEPIIATCNRFPYGIDPTDESVHEKPLKYKIIVHAERAAIYKAALFGSSLHDQTMVACWAACPECAQAIVEVGIRRLVVHGERMDATPDRWREDVDLGLWLLDRGSVEVVRLEGPVDAGVTIRFDGKEIEV